MGEGASALVGNIPGLGTLAGIGIDSAMLSDDLGVFEHGIMPKDPNSHMAAESTSVERPKSPADILAEDAEKAKRAKEEQKRREEAEKRKREAEKKKKAEDKKKAQKFENNLYKYGKPNSFFER